MSDQAFTHPQQVRDLLGATIGEEVFNEMERQDPLHRVGNPLPAPPTGAEVAPPQAAPAPVAPQANPAAAPAPAGAPADTTAPAPEGHPGGKEKLVLGKYKTEAEAEDAYHRLLHTNKELMRERDALRGQATPLAPAVVPDAHTPRVEPTVRANGREEVLKSWQEKYGVEAADLEALKTLAREAVMEEVGPERARAAAEARALERYPEIATFRDEIIQFVATDPVAGPSVKKLWDTGDYEGAMELSFLQFDRNRRVAAERAMLANNQVRQEEVDVARRDAGLIPSQVTGVHGTEAAAKQYGPTQEDQRNLENLYRAGHKEPWLRANIGATLPDDLFGIGQ